MSDAFGQVRQIDAGPLNIGYVDVGPEDGTPVVLLHGWPYDIHAYAEAAPALAAQGYRVIVPYLRGFGTTRFRSNATPRNGQQAALAHDVLDLMNALAIDQAIVAGFDWGSRSAAILGALWPERCRALVCVGGYLIVNLEANRQPRSPDAEFEWWHQYYFATDRGRIGYDVNRIEFNRLVWRIASPNWRFDEATFDRTASSFDNLDHVAIVIHNHRWRLCLEPGESRYKGFEIKLARLPAVDVPTITMASDIDRAAADGSRFTGWHEHRTLRGVGQNAPQEQPHEFVRAIIDADRAAADRNLQPMSRR
jgi:pimeloyl-ACP methyl ester carboxylesterase